MTFLIATNTYSQEALPSPSPQESPQTVEPNETVRVDTDLVDLNVTVFSLDPRRAVGKLEQKDFSVLEDGVEQEISLFTTAEAPFDLVLLIDLSASTKEKLNLIRTSATNFVDAARPTDRIAIVTFTDRYEIVSPFTFEREDLKARIKKMKKPKGGTNFWDALRYVVEMMLAPSQSSRRGAVVMMTDGVDNALPDVPGEGSKTDFPTLIEIIRRSESVLIPIYLDTEREMIEERRIYSPLAYLDARQQLSMISAETGSRFYYARAIEDLKYVYEQVIRDLSTIYSIGYRPTNRTRDGSWRTVKLELLLRPDLAARARRGYFAK